MHQIEAAGISTLCMGAALDIMKAVNPPRGVFVDYPLGHTAGKPNQPELQREILMAALEAFNALTEPDSLQCSRFSGTRKMPGRNPSSRVTSAWNGGIRRNIKTRKTGAGQSPER